MMTEIYLCFFGDSALWDNIVGISAYPSNFSYHRPFRYRDKWITENILTAISSEQGRRELVGREINICMRFRSEGFNWHVVPIRKGMITHIDYLPGNHSFYFQLGPLFNLMQYEDLHSSSFEIRPSDQKHVRDTLVLELNDYLNGRDLVSNNQEDTVWVKYTDLVAHEEVLPIKDEPKKGLFMRFSLQEEEIQAPIDEIHQTSHYGPKFGSILMEGSNYELIINHRVPYLIGRHTSIIPTKIEYKGPTTNIEFSRSEEEITGNYQKHIITITGINPTETWEEITVTTNDKSTKSQDGQDINTFSLLIPIKVKINYKYRIKTLWIPLGILWGSLFFSVYFDKIMGEDSGPVLPLLLAATSLLSSFAIFYLQQRGISAKT